MSRPKEFVHMNRTQLRANLIDAQTEVHVVARGEGKTEGILATKLLKNARAMPRGVTVISTPTYEGLLSKTLPPLIRGLERLKVYKDIHYVIGRQVPKNWGWEDPFHKPLRPEYSMHFCTGHAAFFASFNRENSVNGVSGHSVITDEAKFFVREKKDRFFEELTPAIRGQREFFGHLSRYRSFTFTTDMPTNADARWLFEYEDKMDPLAIEVIEGLQYELAMYHQKRMATESKKKRKYYDGKIKRLEFELNQARTGEVFYFEPKGMENMDVLGEETYWQWKMELPDFVFRTSIGNQRQMKVEDGFYPLLDDEHHARFYPDTRLEDIAFDTNFDVTALTSFNCLNDADRNHSAPLELALDWGDHINCLVVGQERGREYRILKSMFVKKPQKIQDLANEFCDYYQHHGAKTVKIPYDHTAKAAMGFTETTYINEFSLILTKRGWSVELIYIGQTANHEFRYLLWNTILGEADRSMPKVRFNRKNCEFLLISMNNAPARQGSKRFEKDKTSEKKRDTVPQEEATHFSDAADTLLVWKYGHLMIGMPEIEGNVYS